MADQDICDFCNKQITSDQSTITERGIDSILKISTDLKDGLHQKLSNKTFPIYVHKMCKNQYTTPSFMKNRKRELEEVERKVNPKLTCRSEFPTFRIAQDCLYCGEKTERSENANTPSFHY